MKDIIIFHNRRSGGHAVINWLAEQLEETVIHHNDCDPHQFIKGTIKYNGINTVTKYPGTKDIINLYSFEDINYDKLKPISNSPLIPQVINSLEYFGVKRDYRNCVASMIKSGAPYDRDEFFNNWKSIDVSQHNIISYEGWVKDIEYREYICKVINIPFTDKGFLKMNSTTEELLTRYKQFEDNDIYIEEMKKYEVYIKNKKK